MARDTSDATPIADTAELAAYLEAGCKPEADFRIGTEHEKFPFFKADNTPVPYEGERSISAVLHGMKGKLGWDAIMDGENIIGLADPSGMGAISLEPGGQFELSGAPLRTLHETCRESNRHLAVLRSVAEPMGIGFLGVGGSPKPACTKRPAAPPRGRRAARRRRGGRLKVHGM